MSSNYFAVNPDGLAKTAPNMRTVSDQARQILTRLQSNLDALGDCWGDDPMGKSFEEQYLTARKQMFDGMQGIVDVVDSTADGLETMAKGFHQTEEQNTANARGFERGTGGTHSGSFTEPNPFGGSHPHGSPRA